jgi:hypothetical protein
MSKVLYNITIRISHDKHDDWKKWILENHIPDVMKTGMFLSYRMHRMIGDEAEDGITYAIGYVCPDMKTLHQYNIHHSSKLQEEHTNRYEGHFGAFRSIMEIIDEG